MAVNASVFVFVVCLVWWMKQNTGWWFERFFMFTPNLEKWFKLTSIFQTGWNQQLVYLLKKNSFYFQAILSCNTEPHRPFRRSFQEFMAPSWWQRDWNHHRFGESCAGGVGGIRNGSLGCGNQGGWKVRWKNSKSGSSYLGLSPLSGGQWQMKV